MKRTNIKLHWTHKARIKRLYTKDGLTVDELAIMYKLPWAEVKRITWNLEKADRI